MELGYGIERDELKNNIHEIQKRGGIIRVAETGNEIVGCICAIIDVRLAEGVYAEIVSLVVSENQRGQGVGKALVKSAEAWSGRHVGKLRVRANVVRKSAHAFYENLGFKEVKQQKIYTKVL